MNWRDIDQGEGVWELVILFFPRLSPSNFSVFSVTFLFSIPLGAARDPLPPGSYPIARTWCPRALSWHMDAETVHYHQVVFTSKSHSNSLSHGIINDDKLNDSTDCSDASELSMEWHQKFDKTYVAQTLTTWETDESSKGSLNVHRSCTLVSRAWSCNCK